MDGAVYAILNVKFTPFTVFRTEEIVNMRK